MFRAHGAKKERLSWQFASWKVRSMLDAEGSVEIARQGRDTLHAQCRKVDIVVCEQKRDITSR